MSNPLLILSIYFISDALGFDFGKLVSSIKESDMSQVFFFDNVNDRRFFWKQFLFGIIIIIATNGLDQDICSAI